RLDRADRARRQDHLAAAARDPDLAVLLEAHAGRAVAVELDTLHHAAGLQPQVGAAEHGLQKAARGRPAPAELLVDVVRRRALVVAGVEILDALDAGLHRRFAERVEQIPAHARMLDPPFAADGVMIAG